MNKPIHKTMTGKVIDMDALLAKNETMPAVGNVRMNARGDELGAGGKIIRSREDIVGAYYEDNPKATPQESLVVIPVAKPVQEKITPTKQKTQESKTHG